MPLKIWRPICKSSRRDILTCPCSSMHLYLHTNMYIFTYTHITCAHAHTQKIGRTNTRSTHYTPATCQHCTLSLTTTHYNTNNGTETTAKTLLYHDNERCEQNCYFSFWKLWPINLNKGVNLFIKICLISIFCPLNSI